MENTDKKAVPVVGTIKINDVLNALKNGMSDFFKAPLYGIVIGLFFALGGIILYFQLTVWGNALWILPVAIGFPLLGPFIVVALYEVSRRLEAGEPVNPDVVLHKMIGQKDRQIPSIAFVMLFFFGIWTYLAHLIFALSFGLKPLTHVTSSYGILLSSEGITMLVAGTLVGGALSFLLFAITVVSLPLLVDKEVDFITGMITSFQAVVQNPVAMLFWGLCIGVLTLLAMVPFFLGLIVVLPVLGHATWHIYRCVVEFEED